MNAKKTIIFLLFLVPILILIFLIHFRKDEVDRLHNLAGVSQAGVFKTTVKKFNQTKSVWTSRSFLKITDFTAIRDSLKDLNDTLPLSEDAKSNAVESCFSMIKAYGFGDWDAFQSKRIPIPNYEVTATGRERLNFVRKRLNMASFDGTTPNDVFNSYHEVWRKIYADDGLFDEVSFITNSVGLFELSPSELQTIRFPDFTDKTNQNFVMMTPILLWDYSKYLFAKKSDKLKVMRLFFITKNNSDASLYMLLFIYDKQSSNWLPCRLSIAYTLSKSINKILIF